MNCLGLNCQFSGEAAENKMILSYSLAISTAREQAHGRDHVEEKQGAMPQALS